MSTHQPFVPTFPTSLPELEPAEPLGPPGACSGPLPPADGEHSPAHPSASAVVTESGAPAEQLVDQSAAFGADISLELATRAHSGTSFVPQQRGLQERAEYASTLASDWSSLSKLATTDEKRATLAEEFQRYREGFRRRYSVMLAAKSACISTMIAGASNFNVRRAQKRSDSADRRVREVLEFRERALKAIRRALCPEAAPIMLGDSDALERLREKLDKCSQQQERMKAVNAAIRKHAKRGAAAQIEALGKLGISEGMAAKLLEPDELRRVGFPSYMITNNGAEIRRLQARIEAVSRNQATATAEVQGEHARLEDNAAENRVRLFFPGKPSADVRDRLKGAGFRWAPSLECWQAYRNHHTLTVAKDVAGPAVAADGRTDGSRVVPDPLDEIINEGD
jgi:hypothetical protein